jgi:hypothetical protein
VAKGGIDLFAWKSETAEGRSDLRRSGDSVASGDLGQKLGIERFGRFGAKGGIDLFAGKSEITEGCSDLREIGDSSDLPGISDVRLSRRYGSDAAGAAQS